jgi:type II secretory pathway pseudopilin PulG
MSSSPHPRHDGESGFVLLAVIVLVVLLLISLAVAAPKMARAIQRDKELEAIHRGEQYRLAIKLYYQKFGAFPTSVDQLLNTNNMRFLRQRYKDPITGKDDWKPILFGQAHVKPLGFFGKPLSAIGGIAASGAVGGGMTPGMYAISSSSTDESGNSTSGNDNTSGSTNSGSAGTPNSGPGSTGSPVGGGMFSSGGSLGSPAGGLGSTPGLGVTASPGATGLGAMGGSTSTPMFGGSGMGPIVGFTLPVDKPSLIDYMEQTAYNKWEFNYDPAADRMQQAVSLFGGGGTTMNSSGAPPSANNMGFGPSSGNNGPGSPVGPPSSGNSGNSGTNSPTSTPQSPNPDSQPQ